VRRNSNALLLIVCLGQFMVILDVSIVNVALPSIKNSLHFSTNGLQWVLNALHAHLTPGFLLLGGRASDLFGPTGAMFFARHAGSFSAALAPLAPFAPTPSLRRRSPRPGHGAALLSPATLAIISHLV